MIDQLSPAAHALRLLHSLLAPEERRELVRVLSTSATLATLWAQVEPVASKPVDGPRVPTPGILPNVPPEIDAQADRQFAELLGQLFPGSSARDRCDERPMIRDDETRRAFDELKRGLV